MKSNKSNMGRPTNDKKNKIVKFRVSQTDMNKINVLCEAYGFNRSDLFRFLIVHGYDFFEKIIKE